MRKTAIVLASVTLLLTAALPAEAPAQPRGVLKGAWHYSPSADWFDPSVAPNQITNFIVLYLYHDALLKPMPDALYSPSLAESWTISPDYRTYKFKLRKGVLFHNGEEMTAEDVVFTFKRYKSGPASLLQGRIERLEAENPHLFSVTFKTPFPDFLEYLLPGASSIGWIVPRKYVEKVGDAEYKKHPVGCGPYKFAEYRPGIVFAGEAFEHYWRKVPSVKRLEFYGVTERPTRYAMVKRAEVDWASSMTEVFYEKVKTDPGLRMFTGISPNNYILNMPAQWDPKSPWADARVRKAASLAIDRKVLAEVNFPEGGPIDSLGLAGDPEAVRFPIDPYDPERARKLMAEAGYAKGFHTGKYYCYQEHMGMGEMLVTYWKAIGIRSELTPLERPVWVAQWRAGKMNDGNFHDVLGAPTMGGRLNYLFGPPNGNYPDIRALWDQYNQSLDPKVRKELMARIQKSIYERTMVIPLIRASTPSAFGPKVKGNPLKFRDLFPLFWPCPFEDIELNE